MPSDDDRESWKRRAEVAESQLARQMARWSQTNLVARLVEADEEIQRLSDALEVAERERDEWRDKARGGGTGLAATYAEGWQRALEDKGIGDA